MCKLFSADDERDAEVRSRLTTLVSDPEPKPEPEIPVGSSTPMDSDSDSDTRSFNLGEPSSDNISTQSKALLDIDQSESSSEILDYFMKWLKEQEVPTNVIKTFNSTKEFENPAMGSNGNTNNNSEISLSLTVGTELKCSQGHVRGDDGVCRPLVFFD